MLGNKANKGDLSRWILISLLFLIATGIAVTRISDTYITVGGQNVTNQATCTVSLDGTGDSSTIQGCINSLSSNGGTVYIKNGTYAISAKITMKSNITLEGEGKGTVLRLANSVDDDVIHVSSDRDVTIRDLVIDGNKAGQTAPLINGIKIDDAINVLVERVEVYNTNSDGIFVGATVEFATIQDSVIHDNIRNGIALWDNVNHSSIINNFIYNQNTDAIWNNGQPLYPNQGNIIMGNTIKNSYNGIYCDAWANGTTVTGNTIINISSVAITGNGDYNDAPPYGQQHGLIVNGNTILFSSQGITCNGIIGMVSGNNIVLNTTLYDGIRYRNCTGKIEGNFVSGSNRYNINLENSSTVTIYDSYIRGLTEVNVTDGLTFNATGNAIVTVKGTGAAGTAGVRMINTAGALSDWFVGSNDTNNRFVIKDMSTEKDVLGCTQYDNVQIGNGLYQANITMTSPDLAEWCCSVSNIGAFLCASGACS